MLRTVAAMRTWFSDGAERASGSRAATAATPSSPAPDAVSSDCSQVVEIVAPDGRRCARITFREKNAPDCRTGYIDQGWDGTVVRQAASGSCTWRWWPGLFGG